MLLPTLFAIAFVSTLFFVLLRIGKRGKRVDMSELDEFEEKIS